MYGLLHIQQPAYVLQWDTITPIDHSSMLMLYKTYLLYTIFFYPHVPEELQKSSERICGMLTAFSVLIAVVVIILVPEILLHQMIMSTTSEGYDDSYSYSKLYIL